MMMLQGLGVFSVRSNHPTALRYPYLEPNRLADVLALIQVLAYHSSGTNRSEEGLREELARGPATRVRWSDIAREHPEFFRVRPPEASTIRVALLARYVKDRPGNKDKPPLGATETNKLMELAIELHNEQRQHKDRWRGIVLPVALALIGAIATLTAALGPRVLGSYTRAPSTYVTIASPGQADPRLP